MAFVDFIFLNLFLLELKNTIKFFFFLLRFVWFVSFYFFFITEVSLRFKRRLTEISVS